MNSSRVLYISDFFLTEVVGGGELNDDVLCNLLIEREINLKKIRSSQLKIEHLKKNDFLLISNFILLKKNVKEFITNNCDYLIYEHDHKYLLSRNPGLYKDYKAPKNQITNYSFYKNAKKIITQTIFHKRIIEKNLELNNITNISGNLWQNYDLEFMREISKMKKNNRCAVLDSCVKHKNTIDAIKYCHAKKIEFSLVSSNDYHDFLSQLGKNQKFVFFPKTPETLSRVVVESRMMNMGTVINKNVGASYEKWFQLKGPVLIDHMVAKRQEIVDKIIEIMNEK